MTAELRTELSGHRPVMLKEVLHYLAPTKENGIFIDSTIGEGGHSEAILAAFPHSSLIGIDADVEILQRARLRLADFADRTQFVNEFFDSFYGRTAARAAGTAHRILFDLGISTFHYTQSGRGFSFSACEAADMRLMPSDSAPLAQRLRGMSEDEIAKVLFVYGEEPAARRIARSIVRVQQTKKIESSAELANIIVGALRAASGKAQKQRSKRSGRSMHAATRSFQAFRILVNKELDRLEAALRSAFAWLEVGGRMGVISFHSLEDRIVKKTFREFTNSCICPANMPICTCGGAALAYTLFKKPLSASEEELALNPPSRSAKFRVIEKLRTRRKDT